MEDGQIVDLYWQREERAVTETERKYGAYLSKIAMNILGNREDSEEGVNDTYLAAWNSMPTQRPSVLSAYLAKLTRRIAIDLFRRRNRQKRRASEYALSLDELAEVADSAGGPEEEAELHLLGDAINRFLRNLPEDERNTFIGRYYYLDSVKDVALYCGFGVERTKSMLFRTRKKLRNYLKEEGFDL